MLREVQNGCDSETMLFVKLRVSRLPSTPIVTKDVQNVTARCTEEQVLVLCSQDIMMIRSCELSLSTYFNFDRTCGCSPIRGRARGGTEARLKPASGCHDGARLAGRWI